MNLSHPYEAVLPSLDGPVLMTLARLNAPVTGRQVHRLAGTGSEAGVRNVLTRLVEQGIVHVTEAGSALLYQLNREHIAWPAVQALAGVWGEFLKRLRSELLDWSPRARSAALFGSAARGDGDIGSDIVILVVRQRATDAEDSAWLDQVARLRDRVFAWTGNVCQVYELGSADLERRVVDHDPLVAEWSRDAVTLAGADLPNLLRALGHRRSA